MTEETPKPHLLTNELYDFLKFLAQILLPAFGTLYFALATIWGLPDAQEVVGTVTAVDAFLGVLLGVSTKSYNNSDAKYDGSIDVTTPDDGPKKFSLCLNSDPEELESKNEILFKVNSVSELPPPA